MEFTSHAGNRMHDVVHLFEETFTASDGAAEGHLVSTLAHDLFTTTRDGDLHTFLAHDTRALVGAVMCSRLRYQNDQRSVFILAPVAVAVGHQRKGIGQALLRHGMCTLKGRGVEVLATYGDPNFYAKVGFLQIDEATAPAPQPLTYPHGWQMQSLTDAPLVRLEGPAEAMAALNKPEYW